MKTYIIKTKQDEYYCGKTNNLDRRLKEHKEELKPNWFGFKKRKNFHTVYFINGDLEKNIKRFGIKQFLKCLEIYGVLY